MNSEIAIVNSYANVKNSKAILGNQHNDLQDDAKNPANRENCIAERYHSNINKVYRKRRNRSVPAEERVSLQNSGTDFGREPEKSGTVTIELKFIPNFEKSVK